MLSFFNSLSQTNLIKNPSFEWRQSFDGSRLLPVFYSYYCYPSMGVDYYDEVTRCLGDYDEDHPSLGECFYPTHLNRHLTKANGGCDGWYNPLDEDFSTPDYLNRNVDGERARYVDVPNNYFNNFGVGVNHRQEPYDDNNNQVVDEGDEDAYIGIWNVRCLNNPNDNYAEYVTQRFSVGNHLKAHTKYLIRFRVSWTNGIVDNSETGQTGHYLKGIGAYFSATDPFENRRQNPRPLDLNDNTEDLVYNADYHSSTSATYYNNTGGADGKHWDIVENYYQPTENKYFITIGNFKNIWVENVDFKGPDIPNDSYINIYYFIDAVEVIEVPDFECTCSSATAASIYDISLVPKLKDPNSDECCFDVFLTVAEIENRYDICHVNKAKIFEVFDDPYEERYKGEFTLGQGYFHQNNNVKIIQNLCFTEPESTPKKLKVYLYQDYAQKCTIIKDFIVSCLCGCEPEPPPPNKLNINLSNYSQDLLKQSCCWDIEIKNESDCNFSLTNIYADFNPDYMNNVNITLNESSQWSVEYMGIIDYKARYKYSNPNKSVPPNSQSPMKFGKICMEWGSPQNLINLKLKYANEEDLCDREWNFDLKCEDCCQKIHTTVDAEPYYDEETDCCFNINLNIEPGFLCGIKKYRIVPENQPNHVLWEEDIDLHVGQNILKFCISKTEFNNNHTLAIKIKYLLENNVVLCESNGIINTCLVGPLPCDPELMEIPGWAPEEQGFVNFLCPPNNTPCLIDFTFTYRHVKIGNVSDHRDIQVLKWKANPSCNCPDEYTKAMIKAMLNNQNVIDEFGIDDLTWQNGEERCFDNFRVISTECWQSNEMFPPSYRKCNDATCCYGVYRVCYTKSISGEIQLSPNYQNMKLSDYIIPIQCLEPCFEVNCTKWIPSDVSTSHRISINENNTEKISDLCIVFIKVGNDKDIQYLTIECSQKGSINIIMSDILGNIVMNLSREKTSYVLSIPIEQKLNYGIYFINVKLDNISIFTEKIFFLK
ncbi:MAG: T9SS type A sorting domain-containing protein [Candidatus Kapabacteria bacterium]|nr:T9SS type A sorting domain-containing protein [Candidatus Kapabacteria bacterium]